MGTCNSPFCVGLHYYCLKIISLCHLNDQELVNELVNVSLTSVSSSVESIQNCKDRGCQNKHVWPNV